jgi:hypothetical protein
VDLSIDHIVTRCPKYAVARKRFIFSPTCPQRRKHRSYIQFVLFYTFK